MGKAKIIQRREKLSKPYIAVSIKRGAILQCETEGYSRRSGSHSNLSFGEKETVRDRGKWEGKCRLCCVEKRQPYCLRNADCSHIDLFITFLLQNASHCCITLHKGKLC